MMAPEVSIRTDTWRVRASRTTITLLRMARPVGLEPTIGAMNADTRFPGEPTTNYRTTAYGGRGGIRTHGPVQSRHTRFQV